MKSINKKELSEIFNKLKQNKSEIIFNELYNKYENLIYRIAFSIIKNDEDSKEIKQIVFLKIWNTNKKTLPDRNESSWLYSLTKNETLNYIKKKRNDINIEDVYYINSENKELEEILDKDLYNKTIAKLNEKEQEIVSLKVLANLSFNEISKFLNEPVGTIKWRYYKAINTLKILLSNLGMFIITFVIGIKNMFSTKQEQEKYKEEPTKENVITEEENTRQEEKTEILENASNKVQEDIVQSEETKEEIITTPENETNINYYGVGILSVSYVFLTLTIIFTIFFTKYQLKAKKKLSK